MSATFRSSSSNGISASSSYIRERLHSLQAGNLPAHSISDLLEHAYNLLQFSSSELDQNLGLAVICHAADNLHQDSMVRALLYDCISACSNFLYVDMVSKRYGKEWCSLELNDVDGFRRNFYRRGSGTTLTKQQHQLLRLFKTNPRLVVSAPTSFGKTRLLQEIILHRGYKQIALIMPTIALIAETVRRFRHDERFSSYAIVNSATVPIGNECCIYVLTPEKLDLLLDDNEKLQFDFFAMDEIYKIEDDDDRRAVFASVLYRLSLSGADFYLIGPYFKHFSARFLERTQALFRHYALEIVQKDEIRLESIPTGEVFYLDGKPIKKAKTDATNLKRVVQALNEQQLIYQSTKRGTESVARMLPKNSSCTIDAELIGYIKENISEEWSLVHCLQNGVAFHHGAMPRYIQAELVDSFNRGQIRSLVCTTTLTEGVNTTAKNVILFSNMKGEAKLTGFDYKNIKGRAGRFLHHFVGRVITFYKVEEQERDMISFHYLDDENLQSDEVLYIEEGDLLPASKAKRLRVIELLNESQVPVDLIRLNKYISVEKQLTLIKRFREDSQLRNSLTFHGNIPDSNRFEVMLNLMHEYLFNIRDYGDRNFTFGDLKRLTKFYVYHKPSLKEMIATQNGASPDTKIRRTFYLQSHYFEFAFPKYFSCFENLCNFVLNEAKENDRLRLGYVITLLQYGFTEPHEIALKDAGLPDEVIEKVSPSLRECRSFEEIRLKLRIDPSALAGLSDFERSMFKKTL